MKNELKLSERDLEILNYRRSGLTLKEIANKVFLSTESIKKKLTKLRSLTGSKNDIELINYCHSNGYFNKVA